MKEFLDKILNGANVFLLVITLLTLGNSFLSYRDYHNLSTGYTQEVEVRVLNSYKDSFNRIFYHVFYDGSVWKLEAKKYLETGKKVIGQAEITKYDFGSQTSSYDQYKLSLGIVGEIKLSKIDKIQTNCDLICKTLTFTKDSKRYLENRYYKATCQDYKTVSNIFAFNSKCQDVFALSYGLVLGGSEKFIAETYSNTKTLGLTHLIVVSGFQVVLVVSFLEVLLNKLNISRKSRFIFIILGIIGLVLIAGPQPPILRSSLSILISLFALTFLGRSISTFRTLIYSGVLLLWLNPFYLFSVSFQLSFLATLGLIFAGQKHSETDSKFFVNFWNLLKATTFAFLFTLPIILNMTGKVTFLAILTNLLVVPTIPFITILNIIGAIPIIGQLALFITTILQSLIIFLINKLPDFSWLEFLTLRSADLGILEILSYYTVLIVLITTTPKAWAKFMQTRL